MNLIDKNEVLLGFFIWILIFTICIIIILGKVNEIYYDPLFIIILSM